MQDILNVLSQVTEYVRGNGFHSFFFLGDVFHSRTKLDVDVYSATWLAFRELCGQFEEAYILVGNHDQNNKAGDIHSLEPFKAFSTVIDTPRLYRSKNQVNSGLHIALHPFTTDMKALHTFIRELPSDLDLFLFHQGLKEAATGAFDVHVKAEIALAELPLKKARFLRGGHYHKKQQFRIGGELEKVGYIGSPLQLSFSERTEPKSFTVVDTNDWLWQEVPTRAPIFQLYDLGPTGDCSFADFWETVVLRDPESIRSNFVRVRCLEDEGLQLKKAFPNVQIEVVSKIPRELPRISASVATNDRQLLAAYVKSHSPDFDEGKLLSLGMELLTGPEE